MSWLSANKESTSTVEVFLDFQTAWKERKILHNIVNISKNVFVFVFVFNPIKSEVGLNDVAVVRKGD